MCQDCREGERIRKERALKTILDKGYWAYYESIDHALFTPPSDSPRWTKGNDTVDRPPTDVLRRIIE